MRRRSLRSRLVIGSVVWAVGLFSLAIVVATVFLTRHPGLFRLAHAVIFSIVALVCLIVGLAQVRRGLSPIDQLRERLAAVREGRERRVEGSFPTEVQPLVDDLNALLGHREQVVSRALTKAGDLAHGLKTPLAVLSREADLAEAAGHADLAEAIRQQVTRMNRQMDYHLAHARAAGSGAAPGARCRVADSAEGLARTLRQLHADRALTIDVQVPPDHAVRGGREDLDEMLGNLLDNACKWAASRVLITSSQHDARVVILVDDDGPGLDPAFWDAVLQRGVRADEAGAGSGLGLAIVRDLAELYGGSISLGRSPQGGVRARLELPVG